MTEETKGFPYVKSPESHKNGCRLYDHFGYLHDVYPSTGYLLGKEITWTIKEDGSNCGIYWNTKMNRYCVCSRNQDVANFEPDVMALPAYKDIISFLDFMYNEYHSEYIVYAEFMKKGWSPTHLKQYEENSIKVFDIWDIKEGNYLKYQRMEQLITPFNIPYVDIVSISVSNSLDDLDKHAGLIMDLMNIETHGFWAGVKRFIKHISPRKEEGLVGKCIDGKYHYYFKYKYHKPVVKIKSEGNKVQYPQIEESELLKCIYKVRDMLKPEEFQKTDVAMPLVAKEVQLECKQTATSNRIPLFPLYDEVRKAEYETNSS